MKVKAKLHPVVLRMKIHQHKTILQVIQFFCIFFNFFNLIKNHDFFFSADILLWSKLLVK